MFPSLTSPIIILLFSLLFPSTILACNLNCFHGASCEAGVASFQLHPTKSNGKALDMHIETSRNGYHCSCPPGYTGLLCGIKYIDCEDSNHMCYNGGKCILGLKDLYGNDQLYCDCSEALDKNGVSYVGKYCEIPQSQTCDENGEVFCVNGGWCKEDYEKYPRRPCHCGTKHEGPHCEFEKGTVPDCTLKCHNKGICRRGMKKDSSSDGKIDYDFWKAHSNYQYCECPEGYHGLQCEIHSTKCGSHDCFNGGDCVTITTGTRHEHYCDCTKAHANNVAYGGQFCQYEADDLCESHKKINGQQFCLNNGECRQNGSEIECKCPEGFHGPTCEFEDSPTPNLYENCTLQCENDGKCQNGAKDNSILNQFGSELSEYTVAYDHNFEHCVCPEGFMGLKCETKVDICGNGQHVCLHGSKCVADGDDFSCDCDVASTTTVALAGEYCQHLSTSICSTDEVSSMSNQLTFAFCVNNGQCVDIVGEDNLEHPGCRCPAGYDGPHCEFVKKESEMETVDDSGESEGGEATDLPREYVAEDNQPKTDTTLKIEESKGGISAGGAFGIIAVIVIVMISLLLFLRGRYRQYKDRQKSQAVAETEEEMSQFVMPPPNTSTKRYRDFLGTIDVPEMEDPIRPSSSYHENVFSNVEIL